MAAHTCHGGSGAVAADRQLAEVDASGSSRSLCTTLICSGAQHSKNRRTASNMVANFHLNINCLVEHDVDTRPEFDEPDSLPAL
jgi:hypothetical protein